MKTSNKLLIGLAVILFTGIFSSAMFLKGEFEKIDKDDPYYGYVTDTLTSFTAVKMEGKYPGLIHIKRGDQFEVKIQESAVNPRIDENAVRLVWKVQNDTLVLSYDAEEFPKWFDAESRLNNSYSWFDLYVFAPRLTSIQANFFSCKLSGWDLPNLLITQEGENSGIAITESTITTLTATVSQGSMMKVEPSSQIAKAQIDVRDSSLFATTQEAIDSLSLNIDTLAQVQVPGYLLRQLHQGE